MSSPWIELLHIRYSNAYRPPADTEPSDAGSPQSDDTPPQ